MLCVVITNEITESALVFLLVLIRLIIYVSFYEWDYFISRVYVKLTLNLHKNAASRLEKESDDGEKKFSLKIP